MLFATGEEPAVVVWGSVRRDGIPLRRTASAGQAASPDPVPVETGRPRPAGRIQEVDRKDLSQISFTIAAPDTQDVPFLTAEFTLRDRDNNILARARRETLGLKPGDNAISFPVSNIPGGSYFADLWVECDGETLGFGSVALVVKSTPAVKALTLTSDHFKVSDTITGLIDVHGYGRGDAVPSRRGRAGGSPSPATPANVRADAVPSDPGDSALTLRISQEDNFGRLVRDETVPVTAAEMKLALAPIPAPASVYQHITVDLVRGQEILDRKRVSFTYSDLYVTNTIHTTVWQWPQISYLSLRRHEQLYKAGFDSSLECHIGDIARYDYYGLGPRSTFKNGRFEIPVLANLRYVPPVTRIGDMGVIVTPDKQGVAKHAWLGLRGEEPIKIEVGIRNPCVNDPKYVQMLTKRVREVVEHHRTASSSEYMFDQETGYTQPWHRRSKYGHLGDTGEVCFCPHCRKYFQDYLSKEYGTIAAANKEYGTVFKAFDEIQPVHMEEAVTNAALVPLWIDFRMSQDSAYSGMYAKIEKAVTDIQPEARAGDHAPIAFGFRTGEATDMWKMTRWRRWHHPYPRLSGQMQMDFALPGSMISDGEYLLSSHSRSAKYLSRKPWEGLFLGCRYYNCYFGMRGGTLIGHDYSVYRDVRALLDQYREIKSGIGKLLIESERFNGDVAVLYSIASVHKWILRTGDVSSNEMSDNVDAWVALLTDGHGPYKFVSYAQLADGVLSREKFGLLILPWCQALSPAEVDAIKRFVKDGGTVLADLRPGVCDGHGKPYDAAPLDEVFGIVQNTTQPAIKQGIVTVPRTEGAEPEFFGMMLADASLKPGTGRAMGSVDGAVPAFVVNGYGKGKGILLNFSLNGYYVRQSSYRAIPGYRPQNAADVLSFFKLVMAGVNLDRPIAMDPEVKDLRYHMFTSGAARYLGFWQEFPEPLLKYAAETAAPLNESKTTISFKTPTHIYDAREKRYIGYANRITAYFRPDRPRVFALMPYRVSGISVTAPATVRQGEPIAYAAAVEATAQPEKHVLRIELVGPDGDTPRYYTRNVGCKNGKCSGVWQLALNEKPGAYQLVVMDAATGEEGRAVVEVKAVTE